MIVLIGIIILLGIICVMMRQTESDWHRKYDREVDRREQAEIYIGKYNELKRNKDNDLKRNKHNDLHMDIITVNRLISIRNAECNKYHDTSFIDKTLRWFLEEDEFQRYVINGEEVR